MSACPTPKNVPIFSESFIDGLLSSAPSTTATENVSKFNPIARRMEVNIRYLVYHGGTDLMRLKIFFFRSCAGCYNRHIHLS